MLLASDVLEVDALRRVAGAVLPQVRARKIHCDSLVREAVSRITNGRADPLPRFLYRFLREPHYVERREPVADVDLYLDYLSVQADDRAAVRLRQHRCGEYR